MKKLTLLITTLIIFNVCYSQEIQFESAKEKNKNKPELFQKEKSKSEVLPELLETIDKLEVPKKVSLQITPDTKLNGIVFSVNETENNRVVVIKSLDYRNVTFIISKKISNGDNSYRGIILGKDYKDILTLEKDEVTGKHIWYKKELSDILPD